MDNVLDFIEKHKYGIALALILHLGVFVGLNLYKVSNPVEMPERKVHVDVELDDYELELTKEELEALYNSSQGEEVKNILGDVNDKREASYDDYSKFSNSKKMTAAEVKEYEKQMFKDIAAERKAKGEKYLNDPNSDVKIYGGDKGKNDNSEGANSKNKYAGKTVLTYDLEGRGPKDNNDWNIRNPGYRCKGSGKVAVVIKVDKYGVVKEVKLDPSGSSGYTQCMADNALKYARLSKFDYKSSAPAVQTGRIYYNFIAQ
jgi:hypothetical protein